MVRSQDGVTGVNVSPHAPVGLGLRVHDHQVVNDFHLVRVLASVKHSGNVHQILLPRSFGEVKIL